MSFSSKTDSNTPEIVHNNVSGLNKFLNNSASSKPKKEQNIEPDSNNKDVESSEKQDTETSAHEKPEPIARKATPNLDTKTERNVKPLTTQEQSAKVTTQQPEKRLQEKNTNSITNEASNQSEEESESSQSNRTNRPKKTHPQKKKIEHTQPEEREDAETIYTSDIINKSAAELIEEGKKFGIENSSGMLKPNLISAIINYYIQNGDKIYCVGVLDIIPDGGFGFLRNAKESYKSGPADIYVSPNQVKKFAIRTGDIIEGWIRPPRKNEKYFALSGLCKINHELPTNRKSRVHFDNLTPLYPDTKITLEIESLNIRKPLNSSRIIDLVAPIGLGQRALIVAPPRSGKTVLLQDIATSVAENNPNAKLLALLIDERPEEVTDMQRSIKGEVISSTFDEPALRHVQAAEIVIERAKRLVEQNHDVIVLLDSITRLARAYNTVIPSSGKVLTGGIDANALHRPKRFFGAARNIEFGGSLTIIATALIDTGSKMDEVIFEEFKGTGNSEIVLDRKMSEKRLFPAIDINKSGTRKESLLVSKEELNKMWILRKVLYSMGTIESMEFIQERIKKSKNNADFFETMNS